MYDGSNSVRPLFGRNGSNNGNDDPPGRISAKLAYCLLAHFLALDCTSEMALAASEYATDKVESLLHPIAEGEFTMFAVAAGEGSKGVPLNRT